MSYYVKAQRVTTSYYGKNIGTRVCYLPMRASSDTGDVCLQNMDDMPSYFGYDTEAEAWKVVDEREGEEKMSTKKNEVFAVIQFRTDTCKPGSTGLLGSYSWEDGGISYSPIYSERRGAELKCFELNSREEKDEYSTTRYRVEPLELK